MCVSSMFLMDSEQKSAALSKPCVLIIVVASVERFVYKGIASNLVNYLTDVLKMSTSSAAKSVSTWNGVTSMLPLATAILTDSFWDRYSTITVSSLLYIAGLVGLASWAALHYSWMPSSLLFFLLYLISVGQGGYYPSLQAFGAEQVLVADDMDSLPSDEKNQEKSLFFQWWYFGLCSGSVLGISIIPYVQDTFGWGLGFAIPCVVQILSVVAFCCGNPLYTHARKELNTGNRASENIFKELKEVFTDIITRKVSLPFRDDQTDITELELQEKALKDEFADPEEADEGHDDSPNVIKEILGLLPIWTTLLIFAVNFQQPMTFFTKQGMLMNHKVGRTFVIPPAILQSSTTMSVVLLMPLYDKIFVPLMRLLTREENGITVLQRIGIGMVLSVAAMAVAAAVESKRLHIVGEGDDAAQPSIFWLLPQYVLLGVADVFTVVGMQEFFYTQVPSTMKTIGIALYLSVFGFGSFLGTFVISVLETATATMGKGHGWFSDDPREEHLDKYYWFLAVVSTISFVSFTYLCKYYSGPEASRR